MDFAISTCQTLWDKGNREILGEMVGKRERRGRKRTEGNGWAGSGTKIWSEETMGIKRTYRPREGIMSWCMLKRVHLATLECTH